jgi:hypothetical protein
MFSVSTILNVPFPSENGTPKVARVSFPSDDLWIKRSKKRRILVRNLGRNKSESQTYGAEEIDAEIFSNVRLEGSSDLDPADCVMLLDRLSECRVTELHHEGGSVAVHLQLPGEVEVIHRLRIPTSKEILDHRRQFGRVVELPNNQQSIVVDIGVTGALWDRLQREVEGYEGPVPIVHKAIATRAAIDAAENVVYDEPIDF